MASTSMFEFDLSGRCGFAQSKHFTRRCDQMPWVEDLLPDNPVDRESEEFDVERCFAQGRKGFVRLLLTELFAALTSMPLMGAGLSRLTYWNVPNGWICSSEGN